MERIKLNSIYFKKLKGLANVNISFSDSLTAIMGVNGSGKTTVIHAMACLYQPDGNGENHKFPEFFIPNTDALWQGSELYVVNESKDNSGASVIAPPRRYSKDYDRWSPRYENRPKRNIYYIGIDTCLPDIEKKNTTSRINYKSTELTDDISQKAIKLSAAILNKEYSHLLDNTYNKKHFMGVELKTGLKYSSLSMGSGEQRVLKIINTILRAEKYSLILIDEIDLLLHVSALRRLIVEIHKIAEIKHLQIVFTTHSMEMPNLQEHVKIQYIANYGDQGESLIYDQVTSDLIYSMTGQVQKGISVFVEDPLAKSLITELVRKRGMSAKVDIITYGSIENSFTIASSFVITNAPMDNLLIVLDGDKYRDCDSKREQIKKKLTGTEEDAESKRNQACSLITQFNLPEGVAPEEYIHAFLLKNCPKDGEMFLAANEIKAVGDSHEWISEICHRLEIGVTDIIKELFACSFEDEDFRSYLKPIDDWLCERKDI